jgi:hypothetical protein
MQDVSKRALQRYSKRYSVASVTKTFVLKGLQAIYRSTSWMVDSLQAIKLKVLVTLSMQKYLEHYCKDILKYPVKFVAT